ncbi:MAG: hypothetical protein ACE5HV_14270 [Acidobacteriota bacterium]
MDGASTTVLAIGSLVFISLGSVVCQVVLRDEVNTVLDKFPDARGKRPEQNHRQAH